MKVPLFPLHSVLFPGMPLRLHIFEPRYRILVKDCLADGIPFGVVLIAAGQEALGPLPQPHQVGCTARINYLEPVGDGRSNLLAVGHQRFRILHIDRDRPYLTAITEVLSYDESTSTSPSVAQIQRSLGRYFEVLGRLGQWKAQELILPDHPIALAHLACGALQIPAEEKQELLATEDLPGLYAQVQRLLHRELALLDQLSLRGLQRLENTSNLN